MSEDLATNQSATSVDVGASGGFYELRHTDLLPPELRTDIPPILWLPSDDCFSGLRIHGRAAIRAKRLAGSGPEWVDLVTIDDRGRPRANFALAKAIDAILLEQYRDSLEPHIAMRMPFNYSRLPNRVKRLGVITLRSTLNRSIEVSFPSGDPAFVVEWLRDLRNWCGIEGAANRLWRGWPDGGRAAAAISHDVDTDWLFRHEEWIERLCDLEEKHGFRGVWFCTPRYARSRAAKKGIQRLLDRGCEIGCHGYNHDGKLPFVSGPRWDRRISEIKDFVDTWRIEGFRSEWLWRSPNFLEEMSALFKYDSSVPNVSSMLTRRTRNGCGTCLPYKTYGNLLELPLTLPQDTDRVLERESLSQFWRRQEARAERIASRGGLVMLSLHPQPHQSASHAALKPLESCLARIAAIDGLRRARPDRIAHWVKKQSVETTQHEASVESDIRESREHYHL